MNRRWLWAAGAIAGALVITAGVTIRKAARASREAAVEVAAARRVGFTEQRLDRRLPAFEPVSANGMFTDAAIFDGRTYIATLSALIQYDAQGIERNRWRAGLELPSAPLGRMAVGMAGGSNASELYIGTNGAGVVVFDGQSFRQLLPDDRACRKITAILPLATGRILLGTANQGVLAYDGRRLAPFHDSLRKLEVTALAGDVAGIWIGTANQGLYHWNAGVLEHFGEAEGLPDAQVTSLALAGERTFAGTPMGIAEFRRRPVAQDARSGILRKRARGTGRYAPGRQSGRGRGGDFAGCAKAAAGAPGGRYGRGSHREAL